MKRVPIFLALLCALVLTACGLSPGRAEYEMSQDAAASTFQNEADELTENRNGLREAEIQELVNNVKVLHESFYNEWERENEDCILHSDCVPDAESAWQLGNLLLMRFQKAGYSLGYSVQLIAYQDDPEVWILSCRKDMDSDAVDGSLCFAIREDDAQVLCIWQSPEIDWNDAERGKRRGQEEVLREIRYLPEAQYNVWEQIDEDLVLAEACIPDAESALLFGNALLKQFQRDGSFPKYAPHQISYQADPGIWIISCWEALGPDSTSASVSFAIRADDAQVVSIYLGE